MTQSMRGQNMINFYTFPRLSWTNSSCEGILPKLTPRSLDIEKNKCHKPWWYFLVTHFLRLGPLLWRQSWKLDKHCIVEHTMNGLNSWTTNRLEERRTKCPQNESSRLDCNLKFWNVPCFLFGKYAGFCQIRSTNPTDLPTALLLWKSTGPLLPLKDATLLSVSKCLHPFMSTPWWTPWTWSTTSWWN